MIESTQDLPKEIKSTLKKEKIKPPNFESEYNNWYTESLTVIRQLIPDRLNDFTSQYKIEKRKEIDHITYCIYDYLIGLQTSRRGDVIADRDSAIPKMLIQLKILESAEKRFGSSLFDIKEVLQADLFDSELASSKELAKKGFYRAGGVVAGVVLEKHLGHVCDNHNFKSRKQKPTLVDFYTSLKDNGVIDIPMWRFIQHLGDLRNMCGHPKEREPTKDDILELVEGVEKVIKTVF